MVSVASYLLAVTSQRRLWIILWQVAQEPVDLWQNVGGFNTLELLYKDARRWCLTFQSYVQLTMLQNHMRRQVTLSSSRYIISASRLILSTAPWYMLSITRLHTTNTRCQTMLFCVWQCGLKSVRFLSFTVWIVQTSCLITDTFDFFSAVLRAKLLVLQEIAENWDMNTLIYASLVFCPTWDV